MSDDPRCCGTGTCIINAEGLCWCGQRWDGEKMCRPALTPATCQGDWQEAGALMAVVVDLSEQLPRHHEPVRGLFDEALPLNASHGQGFDSLPPGHAVTRSLWVEGAPVSRWQVSGYRNPPRQDKVWQADRWQQGAPQGATLSGQQWQLGLPLHKGWLDRWEEAMQPPWGTSPPPKPPIKPERPDKRTKALFADEINIGERIHSRAQSRGLLVRPIMHLNVMSPPLILTHAQVDEIVETLRVCILEVAAELEQSGQYAGQ